MNILWAILLIIGVWLIVYLGVGAARAIKEHRVRQHTRGRIGDLFDTAKRRALGLPDDRD